MKSTARRYTSPVPPPRLIVAAAPGPAASSPRPSVLCLRCGGDTGHAAPRLVSFAWGRVVTRR